MSVSRTDVWKKVGLASVILLAPGGFVLGAALLAERYRRGRKRGDEPPPEARGL